MADVFSKEKRSEVMSKIRSKDTFPEKVFRSTVFRRGLRFRKNYSKLPGKPDVVFPKFKVVVFIHGCFWHGHEGCKKYQKPKSNSDFWKNKVAYNQARDQRHSAALKELGYKVIVIWECEIRTNVDKVVDNLLSKLS